MHQSCHIHIKGLVQGVGFRPFVCRLAETMHINGWVSNSNDGVHIECTADEKVVDLFYDQLIHAAPANAIITSHHISLIDSIDFNGFEIADSTAEEEPDLLLTPDIAICDYCKKEINEPSNKRYQYPFTTCLNCGPRYSIVHMLPYDRGNTTMAELHMCRSCVAEYYNINNRRHFSQTNSCAACAITMHLYQSKNIECNIDENEIVQFAAKQLKDGKIIAVKGMGGYLLLCDATNEKTIITLRERKHRPAKPFALMYASVDAVAADIQLQNFEAEALKSKAAPIVLCHKKQTATSGICVHIIASGLEKIGVMLPSTGLLSLLADKVNVPMIATSANISGAPIIYKDEEAVAHLFEVADFVLTYDRDIVAPQDDSVVQFTNSGRQIVLRRSRGLAPNYLPNPFIFSDETILAAGGEMKSSFALLNKNNLYISQFLGDQGTLESQESYAQTLLHTTQLLKAKPQKIIVDKHPNYEVSLFGKRLAIQQHSVVVEVQHHKAHFGAVLAENNLLHISDPVLGFIWDGTGYGDDKKIWGSETFIYQNNKIERSAHLQYFPQLVGDKMSAEPRLSALSLLHEFPVSQLAVQKYFSKNEWQYYHKLLQQDSSVLTLSMGRFLDGLACILGVSMYNSYEGETAMRLEALAMRCKQEVTSVYTITLIDGVLDWHLFIKEFLADIDNDIDVAFIARKIFYSLANCIDCISNQLNINHLAFSGGVFQNTLLVEMITLLMADRKQLYFHQQLSPNDEGIGFGQIACYQMEQALKQQYTVLQTENSQ